MQLIASSIWLGWLCMRLRCVKVYLTVLRVLSSAWKLFIAAMLAKYANKPYSGAFVLPSPSVGDASAYYGSGSSPIKVLPDDVAPTTTQIYSGTSQCRSNDYPDLFGFQPIASLCSLKRRLRFKPLSLQRQPRFIRVPANVAPTTTQIYSGSSQCRSNDNPDLFGFQPMSFQRRPRFIRVPTVITDSEP